MYQGKVKWFNNAKGYGFIVEDGYSEDLFAHFSSIQMEGYKTLKAGQAVTFDKEPSGKGTHAVNIAALESEVNNPESAAIDNDVISVIEETAVTTEQEDSQQVAEQAQKATAL